MLQKIKSFGFLPNTVIDGRASDGSWTREAKKIFPDANYWLFEPRYSHDLANMENKNTFVTQKALADVNRVKFFENGLQSGCLSGWKEGQEPILVDCVKLRNYNFMPPILLKLDIQGMEIAAMRGAKAIHNDIEVAILEVSLIPFLDDIPIFADVIRYMSDIGFNVYAIMKGYIRPINKLIGQYDIMFVNKNSSLLKETRWYDI